ncbi:MAG: isochorismatase family protein [Isosphaeraceae bacterium]|nr:isochorismatase family protein [Isosphaeraceae bacterium]
MTTARSALLFGFALTALLSLLPAAAHAGEFALRLRSRSPIEPGSNAYTVVEKPASWDPAKTAVIVCDMWDLHHCKRAVDRGAELTPTMDRVLSKAREAGALIIHAPSSCMEAYADHPARKRAQAAPLSKNLPEAIGEWCYKIPAEERGTYPIDQTDGGEDDEPAEHAEWAAKLAAMGRNPKAPWKSQTKGLRIDPERDCISDSGTEIWSILEQRGIDQVVLLGVHTNMCVLGRPFGLRQMAKNGKKVVLMRDMTDTMYNPAMPPKVSHFAGTDLIIEHIEKFVCPTITSDQILGGKPFRFANDRRPRIALVIGDDEYRTETTLPAFAAADLIRKEFQVEHVFASESDKNDFPNVAAIDAADLLVISTRRRFPRAEQLAAIRAHVAAGKPIVGIRTASHAFATRSGQAVPPGHAAWNEFDPEILGGHYVGHHGVGPKTRITRAEKAGDHPILAGIDVDAFVGNGSLYRVAPLAGSATPLLIGTIDGKPSEPIAWIHRSPAGGKVFYTSLGHPDDFADPNFRRLLGNALSWAALRD